MAVEGALIERIGEPGRRLHTARSRNDQVALDIRLWCREAIGILPEKVSDLQRAFVKDGGGAGPLAGAELYAFAAGTTGRGGARNAGVLRNAGARTRGGWRIA